METIIGERQKRREKLEDDNMQTRPEKGDEI